MRHAVINRRTLAGLAVAALVAGCASGPPLSAEATHVPIGAIHVSGNANIWLQQLAPMVSQEIAGELGTRYQPGARGAAVLAVDLTDVDFPSSSGGTGHTNRHMHEGPNTDFLQGNVSLVSASRHEIASFPLVATKTAIDSSDMLLGPSPTRLQTLAHTFSYWLAQKLS